MSNLFKFDKNTGIYNWIVPITGYYDLIAIGACGSCPINIKDNISINDLRNRDNFENSGRGAYM